MNKSTPFKFAITLLGLPLLQCGSSTDDPADPVTYAVNVTVDGIDGTLILRLNDEENLSISSDGTHPFDLELEDGEDYEVTIETLPNDQSCSFTRMTGTIDAADADVVVTCEAQKNIFRTAIPYDGNLGGIAGADAVCMADADYPGNGNYKAMIVDGVDRVACTTPFCSGGTAEHTNWVFDPNTTYELADNTRIGITNDEGIFDFPIDNTLGDAGIYWTGMTMAGGSEWEASDDDCIDWNNNTAGEDASVGSTFETDYRVIWEDLVGLVTCDNARYLICVEQ